MEQIKTTIRDAFSLLVCAICCPLGAAIAQGEHFRPRPTRAIFVGPSLYGHKREARKGELWLGPARGGDILEVIERFYPRQIVLIDGVFHQSLSVWHKELVYALLKNIVVIGAASMGALRASELAPYGMIGVGRIFERYLAGEEDDSLVAMSFDPQTYQPLADAPIGQELKRADALAAIAFARQYKGKVKTSLDRNAFGPYLEAVLERIKNHG